MPQTMDTRGDAKRKAHLTALVATGERLRQVPFSLLSMCQLLLLGIVRVHFIGGGVVMDIDDK
jgi:hypothetical protein